MAKKPQPVRPQPKQKPKVVAKTAKPAAVNASGSRWEPAGWLKWALIAMAITGACYLPTLSHKLVNWDDDPNITENPNLQHIDGESLRNIFDIEKGNVIGNYNPLPIFTFALEKMAAGEINTTLIHFDNLLLHVLTVFFVFRLLLHMGIGTGGAFIGGLLFGIHPMRVESVAWATERKDVLFAVFFFAALMYYVRWIKTKSGSQRTVLYIGMLALALLSGFSKVQAVTLPLSMLALDYWFRRPIPVGNFIKYTLIMLVVAGGAFFMAKSLSGKSVGTSYFAAGALLSTALVVVNYAFRKTLPVMWEKTPFLILSVVFGLINTYTLTIEGSTNDEVTNFNFLDRLCIGAYSFCVYLYKVILPYPMSPLYPYPKPLPVWVYLSPVLFFAVWFGVYRLWKMDRRMWIFGMLFFFFNVMFLLQVFGAGQGFLADRFTYVPYFGFLPWWPGSMIRMPAKVRVCGAT
ncbi:MAG: hypothetical protein IPM81_17915 [Saprospirales bacterium]|nr:hypothetical protein [Saprospirales bacterium]